ncbi:hypothetical protein DRO69_10600 [Candidatus Bathyarchaeota archaeon]|nr:MAG: hypothetical protein DRO69_10600 [Candidatus Bathyarchaeota archaeon]
MRNQKKSSRSILVRKVEEFLSQGRNKFYLREIVEEAHVSLIDAENFFLPLLKEHEVKGFLEVRCPTCEAELGTYKRYPEIPEELFCEFCETEFPRSSEYVEIVLEVVGKFFRATKDFSTFNSKKTHKNGNEQIIERCY